MPLATHPPETDLLIPLPDGEDWDPHTIHTHYFGLSVPEARLGAFLYLRYQPVFRLCSGGVCIFAGLDNERPLDIEYIDYVVTMPYPDIVDNTVTTANGLRVEFTKLGEEVRLSYRSPDGETSFDVVQTALMPLVARGHVMPGEDLNTDPTQLPGGTEQFMHCVGELIVNGRRHDVDCYPIRDRSWRQVRTEGEVRYPPVGWSPIRFSDDLMFNQIGFEPLDTDPAWKGLFEIPGGMSSHYYGFVYTQGEARQLVRVRRNVLEYHPRIFAALKQEIEAEDEAGQTYHFTGEAIAMAHLPSWPNALFVDSVYRWEDQYGQVAHCTYQEAWFHTYQRAMRERRSEKGQKAGVSGATTV